MGLTIVKSGVIEDDSITSANIDNATIVTGDIDSLTITSAKMAVDPTNATNLNAGDVPAARLDNAPATDTTALQDEIALLAFKTQANGSLARYDLVDQSVDAFEDASGVDASASTNETRNAANYYSGYALVSQAGNSSSGILNTYGAYASNTFLTSSTFDAGTAGGTVDILLVGGGGSGGNGMAGGGGAGQVRTLTSQAVAAGSHTVTIADGGPTNAASPFAVGVNGGITSFASLPTAIGGGGGGSYSGLNGLNGASGGGGGGSEGNGMGTIPGGSGSAGNSGGHGTQRIGGQYGGQGGGGGAGGSGSNGTSNGVGGAGGAGVTNDYRTGSNIYYGGGGGGADYSAYAGGAGGSGGGGRGPTGGGLRDNTPGTANTGGGGGGSYYYAENNVGGSGIVVVRYTADSLTVEVPTYNNMTLVSNATAAQAAPTKGDIVFTYTNGAGTAVINTNITAEISADDGSTWTAFTLASQGTTGGHTILTSHDQTITSTITAPYNMKYRIKTLVQSTSLFTRIQAVALGWS